jgi:hypothetical protein
MIIHIHSRVHDDTEVTSTKYKALRIPWTQLIIKGGGWNNIMPNYLEPMGGRPFFIKV